MEPSKGLAFIVLLSSLDRSLFRGGEQTCMELSREQVKEWLEINRLIIRLGEEGPDPFTLAIIYTGHSGSSLGKYGPRIQAKIIQSVGGLIGVGDEILVVNGFLTPEEEAILNGDQGIAYTEVVFEILKKFRDETDCWLLTRIK